MRLLTAHINCAVAAHRCPSLPSPRNGYVTDDVTVDSLANYTCNDGYLLIGNSSRRCQYNGEWTGFPPLCRSEKNLGNLRAKLGKL